MFTSTFLHPKAVLPGFFRNALGVVFASLTKLGANKMLLAGVP